MTDARDEALERVVLAAFYSGEMAPGAEEDRVLARCVRQAVIDYAIAELERVPGHCAYLFAHDRIAELQAMKVLEDR